MKNREEIPMDDFRESAVRPCAATVVTVEVPLKMLSSAVLILVLSTSLGKAQVMTSHQQPSRSSAQPSNATILADGAVNPSAIPDEVAFEHFFRFLAKDSNAANEEVDRTRRASYLAYFFKSGCGPSGQEDRSLSDSERTAVMEYGERVAQTAASVAALGPGGAAKVRDVIVEGIYNLELALGRNAAQKVRAHVNQHVKSRIKIVQNRTGSAGSN